MNEDNPFNIGCKNAILLVAVVGGIAASAGAFLRNSGGATNALTDTVCALAVVVGILFLLAFLAIRDLHA